MNPDPKNSASMPDDEAEPTAGYSPAPIALIILFAVLVFWGMLYLDDHGGGFNKQVYPALRKLCDRGGPVSRSLDPAVQALKDEEKLLRGQLRSLSPKQRVGDSRRLPAPGEFRLGRGRRTKPHHSAGVGWRHRSDQDKRERLHSFGDDAVVSGFFYRQTNPLSVLCVCAKFFWQQSFDRKAR